MDQRERFEAYLRDLGDTSQATRDWAWPIWQAAEAAALERAAQVCEERARKLVNYTETELACTALNSIAQDIRKLAAPVGRGGDR
jgi:hypothetical protein